MCVWCVWTCGYWYGGGVGVCVRGGAYVGCVCVCMCVCPLFVIKSYKRLPNLCTYNIVAVLTAHLHVHVLVNVRFQDP